MFRNAAFAFRTLGFVVQRVLHSMHSFRHELAIIYNCLERDSMASVRAVVLIPQVCVSFLTEDAWSSCVGQYWCGVGDQRRIQGGPGVHGPPSPPKEGTPTPKIKKMNKIKPLQSSYRPKSYVITKIRGPTTTSADQRGAVSHF